MKAVLCKSLDGPDALEICELPAATPGEGEVAIRVSAVSLNFFDTLVLYGKYQNRPELPFSPGGEVAGHGRRPSGRASRASALASACWHTSAIMAAARKWSRLPEP